MKRCPWAASEPNLSYHDLEWGVPVHDDRLLFTASAERTEDATRDGPVTGSAMGVIGPDEQARWCMLTDPYGDAYAGKVEGVIAPSPDHSRLLAVVDADDPTVPSLLCDVELRGSWAP